MRNMDRVIFGCLMLCGIVPGAFACTTSGWNGGASGATNAASPPTVTRVSEFCGLKLTNTGHVQDNNPAHTAMIARFYVLPQLTGSGDADLFIAYSSETPSGVLFDVAFDGSNFDFSATGGGSASVAAAAGWNLIEISYTSGGNIEYWVNADATVDPATGSFAAGSGTVQAVRLGLPNGLGGFSGGSVSYDAYESHASTPVGDLLIGDANGNGSITIADVITVGNELNGTLASGQPDCNRSGAVTIADVICVGNTL